MGFIFQPPDDRFFVAVLERVLDPHVEAPESRKNTDEEEEDGELVACAELSVQPGPDENAPEDSQDQRDAEGAGLGCLHHGLLGFSISLSHLNLGRYNIMGPVSQ